MCVCELTCETSSVASSSRASACFSFMWWFVIVDAHVRCLSLLFFGLCLCLCDVTYPFGNCKESFINGANCYDK